ncbi:DUF3152 domain-containing protein [Streptomyces werraensis]|nr:DUF3152 domain-containing protein [Streptomyces werraensis]
MEGPRRDYVEAFDRNDDLFTPRKPVTRGPADPHATVTDRDGAPDTGAFPATDAVDDEPPTGVPAQTRGGKGRAFTGIAAAAVTTVLAVVVAGQVTDEHDSPAVQSQSVGEQARDARDSTSRGDGRATPGVPTAKPLTYEQQMDRKFPLAATRGGTGRFYAVKGIDKAPGKGRKVTYRVDVERGLDLDGALFAEAVHRTLNDRRSWAHDGLTFERIESGDAEFVITLASPGTTADWCAKSGLDTTEDNVSCDSAATERVLINAYRWAQGAETYGDKMFAYRQMLINHEIGHRLGHNHVTCDKDGDLAPVMQQQTKFLEYNGISCRPTPGPTPTADRPGWPSDASPDPLWARAGWWSRTGARPSCTGLSTANALRAGKLRPFTPFGGVMDNRPSRHRPVRIRSSRCEPPGQRRLPTGERGCTRAHRTAYGGWLSVCGR